MPSCPSSPLPLLPLLSLLFAPPPSCPLPSHVVSPPHLHRHFVGRLFVCFIQRLFFARHFSAGTYHADSADPADPAGPSSSTYRSQLTAVVRTNERCCSLLSRGTLRRTAPSQSDSTGSPGPADM